MSTVILQDDETAHPRSCHGGVLPPVLANRSGRATEHSAAGADRKGPSGGARGPPPDGASRIPPNEWRGLAVLAAGDAGDAGDAENTGDAGDAGTRSAGSGRPPDGEDRSPRCRSPGRR
ncbi:hypothetical protein CP969_04545 [Streptomyces viridosporus T7A]|uniref:Uncharacterized protein n=1 Tax=Streptomyces viridosporus T7A TaxID=665577 RepID=A0ABX6AA78_STRVD|nr:hypothetical protein CP969_04545 [Streptomyces viridosporus T7A]